MNARSSAPLTDKDYERLNKTLTDLANIHMEIQRAGQAGFDCAPEDAMCKQLIESLSKVKAAYFPGKP
jgi:hypothetical protein